MDRCVHRTRLSLSFQLCRPTLHGQEWSLPVRNGETRQKTRQLPRETSARVAAGSIARCLLNAFGIEVASHVVRIGDVEVHDLNGSIAEEGKLHITLLGMEFIRRLDRFELRGRELVLVQ